MDCAVLFINDDKNNEANLQIAFSKLPEIVLCEKLDDIVEELSNNYRVSIVFLQKIKNHYP